MHPVETAEVLACSPYAKQLITLCDVATGLTIRSKVGEFYVSGSPFQPYIYPKRPSHDSRHVTPWSAEKAFCLSCDFASSCWLSTLAHWGIMALDLLISLQNCRAPSAGEHCIIPSSQDACMLSLQPPASLKSSLEGWQLQQGPRTQWLRSSLCPHSSHIWCQCKSKVYTLASMLKVCGQAMRSLAHAPLWCSWCWTCLQLC